MSFIADKQTLEDLNILGKYVNNSIFNVFNSTKTTGGERALDKMFQQPLSDVEQINNRGDIFQFFRDNNIEFPFDKEMLGRAENYLSTSCGGGYLLSLMSTSRRKLLQIIANDREYETVQDGLLSTINFLKSVYDFNNRMKGMKLLGYYGQTVKELDEILNKSSLKWVLTSNIGATIPLPLLAKYDNKLRSVAYDDLSRLMEIVYLIDIYSTVAAVANRRGFVRADAVKVDGGKSVIDLKNVFHPQLKGAVANSLHLDYEKNVIFLTGANMAGKSTFMKSFGIAIYVAHLGFPVAAESMIFSVQDGLYTSINVSDNLNLGYSHFYAEVLRVKTVAEDVGRGLNLVVIFDELFKGTNVKDAYDATVASVEAFASNRNCSYIISTHIVEAGSTLRDKCKNFSFVYFPTVMSGNLPTYTYKLQDGISADRHGMMIIRNEKIIEIINGEN